MDNQQQEIDEALATVLKGVASHVEDEEAAQRLVDSKLEIPGEGRVDYERALQLVLDWKGEHV